MDSTAAPLQKLIEQFARLPGVGRKMAQRCAFYVLDLPEDKAKEFSSAILEAKSKIKKCSVCGNFTEGELCPICSAKGRDTPAMYWPLSAPGNTMESIMCCMGSFPPWMASVRISSPSRSCWPA